MGLNGAGPRDWSPGEPAASVSTGGRAPVASRLPVTAHRAPTASPPHPSIGVTAPFVPLRPRVPAYRKAPRSGAWAPLVLALVAMFVSVVEFRDGQTSYLLLSTVGLVAICGAVVARRKIREGYRGSLVLTSVAITLGAIATVIMLARFLIIALVPGAAGQLPLFLVGPTAVSPSVVQQQTIPRATAVADSSWTSLAQELGTAVYLIKQEPAGTDLDAISLVNGLIVLPDGTAIRAPGATSVHVRAGGVPDDFVISLADGHGNRVRYDSGVGEIERVEKK
jgi:hypothetical protein